MAISNIVKGLRPLIRGVSQLSDTEPGLIELCNVKQTYAQDPVTKCAQDPARPRRP